MINTILRRFDLVPSVGVIVGLASYTFQVKVLYPWHEKLERDLEEVSQKVEEVSKRLEKLKKIE